MARRCRSLLLLVLGIAVLAGCQANATVRIDVAEDGGGSVTVAVELDPEAAARTVSFEGKPLVEDLVATGWAVSGPEPLPNGWTRVTALKAFSQADQLRGVIEEVAGPNGPLRDFELERPTSFGKREWSLHGTVDLRGGLAAFGDEQLTAALGGLPLGHDEAALEAALGRPLESLVSLQVQATMPGSIDSTNGVQAPPPPRGRPSGTTSSSTTAAPAPGQAPAPSTTSTAPAPELRPITWAVSFADPAPLEIQATSSTSQLVPRLWRWLAIAAAVLGGCALLYQASFALLERRREQRRAKRRRRGPVGMAVAEPLPEPVSEGLGAVSRADERATVEPPPPTDGDGPPSSRVPAAVWSAPVGGAASGGAARPVPSGGGGLRLLVIETAGVLFDLVDPVDDLLVPYVRARGSSLGPRQIDDWYVARVVGGLPPADFWAGLGVVGDPMLLDDSYARRYELSPDIIEFLRSAGERGLEVAALGDEVPEWVGVFRQRHRLDEVVGVWISSGEVGVRPPHPALLRAVWRATGFAPEDALVVARSAALLDVAASQGARTVHYAPVEDPVSGNHPVLRSFARVAS